MAEAYCMSTKMELGEVLRRLQEAAKENLKEAAASLSLGKTFEAVAPLSYAVSCRFYEYHLSDRNAPYASIVKRVVRELDDEVRTLSGAAAEKNIIHSQPADVAFDAIEKTAGRSERRRLFWIGYFYAEHWANKDALTVFRRLVGKTCEPRILHWMGNLLSKLGRFEEALPFLEKAAAMEPRRYNHQSHLGNVLRGLHRRGEAEICYRRAVTMLKSRPIGRVEHIHLSRCYQGLSALGLSEFVQQEQEQKAAAVRSGEVAEEELNRICF